MSDFIKTMIERYTTEQTDQGKIEFAEHINTLNDYLVENIPDTGTRLNVLSNIIFAHLYIHFRNDIKGKEQYKNILTLYADMILGPLVDEKFSYLVMLNRLYDELKKDYPGVQFSELFSKKIFNEIIAKGKEPK